MTKTKTETDTADFRAIATQARECKQRGDHDSAAEWYRLADELLDSIGARDCD